MKKHRDRYNQQDDAHLVAAVLAGEREAFDFLLERYAPSVLHLCDHLLGNVTEAQDVAQEAALQAFLGLSRLREPARFSPWFHAIAANLARLALRRRRELPLHTLSAEDMTQPYWLDSSLTPEEYQLERELQDSILLALRSLSLVNRQAVIGYYLQGYNYEELAQLLGVPVSTVKGRLFHGRQQLKTLLQPLAEMHLSPHRKQRKKHTMNTMTNVATEDMIELEFESLRRLELIRQHLVVLRDPQTKHGLPIPLTATEANDLEVAFRARQYGDELPFPQDTSQRLLESLGARFQRVVINALAGQTLYATVTMLQGTQTRQVDIRLSEALPLAVRMNAPICISRTLFEAAATLDLTTQMTLIPQEELEARGKDILKQGREQRLEWEEAVHSTLTFYQHRKREEFSNRLWTWLLESLTGAREDFTAAELRALDLVATFPTRELTWDEQPMVAIRLPDQRETAWLLVPPLVWEKITRQLQGLHGPKKRKEQVLGRATPTPMPDVLPPEIVQQVEELLARLVTMPEVRTAFLLNAKGHVVANQGPDTQETLQHYCDSRDDLAGPVGPNALTNERELGRQFGHQPQNVSRVPYHDMKTIRREPREEISAKRIDAGRMLFSSGEGWRMVLFTDRDMKEERRQVISQSVKELRTILAQRVPD